MVKEEKAKAKDNAWTIEELVSLTDKVQTGEVDYKGKVFNYQYCELTESEEPKGFAKMTNVSEDEKFEAYAKLGSQRVLAMILKANEKNPDGATIVEESWGLLPTTLRYLVSNEIMGVQEETVENFQI